MTTRRASTRVWPSTSSVCVDKVRHAAQSVFDGPTINSVNHGADGTVAFTAYPRHHGIASNAHFAAMDAESVGMPDRVRRVRRRDHSLLGMQPTRAHAVP